MHWPPDIADDLPAPRDDEPSSLRQDIADELRDHLQCAFTRELHVTRDEQAAQEKALDRFGDPRAIARKLWFDALKDNIMSQRLTFVALALVALISFGSAGTTWFLLNQARKANEAMLSQSREATAELLDQSRDANRALVEQGQKANEALVAKLGELSASSRGAAEMPASPEWNSVKCRLYTGERPGSPAAGYEVTVSGFVLDTAKEVTVSRVTDSAGIADLGLMRPGQHNLKIKAPWGDQRHPTLITVLPGKAHVEEIQCPAGRPEKTDVTFHVDWPEELRNRDLWAVVSLTGDAGVIGGQRWYAMNREHEFVVVLQPDGMALPFPVGRVPRYRVNSQFGGIEQFGSWPFETSSIAGRGVQPGDELGLLRLPVERQRTAESRRESEPMRYGFIIDSKVVPQPVRCEIGDYRLTSLLVTRPPVEISLSPEQPTGRSRNRRVEFATNLRSLPVVGGLITPRASNPSPGWDSPARRGLAASAITDWIDVNPPNSTDGQRVPDFQLDQQRLEVQPTFVAKAGQNNEWKITLPLRLLEKVGENLELKAEGAAEGTIRDGRTN